MKRTILFCFAACSAPAELEPWQLDHERIVAVRSEPPHITPGEIAIIDALIAHDSAPTTLERPGNAAAVSAPGDLFAAVHFYIDHWQIDGPDETRLAAARTELGLPDGAPVPLEVTLEFPGPLYAKKIVWLGDSRANPARPAFSYGPDVATGEHTLAFGPPPGGSVRWLTSCGSLRDDGAPTATHIVDGVCEGELVLVVRDDAGGVVWQVLPIRAQ
jgi:hypothetical protein